MAQINLRNIPDDLYARVRLAAANGGAKIPKGGLDRFVLKALRRAVEDPQPGAGLPKLKLCAKCVSANLALVNQPKPTVVPPGKYDAAPVAIDTTPKAKVDLFANVDLGEDAAAGMLADTGAQKFTPPSKIYTPVKILAPLSPHQVQPDVTIAVIGEYADRLRMGNPELILMDCGATEVTLGLWVGSDHARQKLEEPITHTDRKRIALLAAAKDPWHRQMLGYKTKSAPEGEERLVARRGMEMALNLIDVRELGPGGEHYVPEAVVTAACAFIKENIDAGNLVLVHAHDGRSAAPGIALVYMMRQDLISRDAPIPAFEQIYPVLELNPGMRKFIESEAQTLR